MKPEAAEEEGVSTSLAALALALAAVTGFAGTAAELEGAIATPAVAGTAGAAAPVPLLLLLLQLAVVMDRNDSPIGASGGWPVEAPSVYDCARAMPS